MSFSKYLLTPLLFLQMWAGFSVIAPTIISEETATSISIAAPQQVIEEKQINPVNIILAMLLITVLYFSLASKGLKKSFCVSIKIKITKIHLSLIRKLTKSKNSYYFHFYRLFNLVEIS